MVLLKKEKNLEGNHLTLSLKADFDFEKPVLQVKMQTTWISGCMAFDFSHLKHVRL